MDNKPDTGTLSPISSNKIGLTIFVMLLTSLYTGCLDYPKLDSEILEYLNFNSAMQDLDSEHWYTREAAIGTLGNIGDKSAVSPVIGVMLMLVVTVILAAAVSGFSGGLIGDSNKASQLAIKADYSQSCGMTITHMGGDILSTQDTKVIVAPTTDFGSTQQLHWEINKNVLYINKDGVAKCWYDPLVSGSSSLATTFQPGEVTYVNVGDLGQVQPKTYSSSTDDSTSSTYGFANQNALGKRFVLSLVDNSGRTIAKTEVVIQP